MNPLLHTLPLDLTGKELHNRTTAEYHNLDKQESLAYRCFVLDHGYFYTDDLIIRDSLGNELKEHTDYQCTGLSKEATLRSGKQVCSIIVINNPRIANDLYVDAQMVGGEYTNVAPTIAEMANGLLNNTRSVQWLNIKDRPTEFKPSGHLHALWEIYGFEGWIIQLQRIVAGINEKNRLRYLQLQGDFDDRIATLNDLMTEEYRLLSEHMARLDNPHRVTAVQLDLDKVANLPVATEPEARALGDSIINRYTTPLRTAQHIDSNFNVGLNSHIANKNNPHKVTHALLGGMPITQALKELAGKLGINDTAVATQRLQGYTYANIYSNSRSNLDAGWVTSGRVNRAVLGTGTAARDRILLGDSKWTYIPTIFSQYQAGGGKVLYQTTLYNGPTAAINIISVTYADMTAYPYGTIVVFKYLYSKTMYNGNGSHTAQQTVFAATMKTSSGWVY